jgi:hypothetical protein
MRTWLRASVCKPCPLLPFSLTAHLQQTLPLPSFPPPFPRHGCLTVNIGDALTRWTDGTLKSTYHRVRTPKEGEPLVSKH